MVPAQNFDVSKFAQGCYYKDICVLKIQRCRFSINSFIQTNELNCLKWKEHLIIFKFKSLKIWED